MSASAIVLAGAAMAMPGPAHGASVEIPGRMFAPASLHALVGETVTWHNGDHAAHSVESERGGPLSSGTLSAGESYAHTFDEPGSYRYFCALHRTMRGTVTVSALGLTGPPAPVRAGEHVMLEAHVPAGTPSVTLERGGGDVVATATPDAGGRATFHVMAHEPASYRARAGELTSAAVRVKVAPRVTVTASRRGERVRVRATIAPAQPGATVALERYVRERFDYRPVATARSASGTSARFTIRSRRRIALKVAVTEPLRGWSVGRSAHVTLRGLR